MKLSRLVLPLLLLFFSQNGVAENQPPRLPDWRSITWPSLDFNRHSIPGGAALYTIADPAARKFELRFLFRSRLWDYPEADAAAVNAAATLLLEGGFGKRSYEQWDRFFSENGLVIKTALSSTGHFTVIVQGLPEDFELALATVKDLFSAPTWTPKAFDTWKHERQQEFQSLLDGGNLSKQYRFLKQEVTRTIYGPNHYASTELKRQSPSALEAISLQRVKEIGDTFVNRAELNVVLSGTFTPNHTKTLATFIGTLPRKSPPAMRWLPTRPTPFSDNKIPVVLIRKPDMTQTNAMLTFADGQFGRLNRIERTQMAVLSEIYSSLSGNLGVDRWSRAMRVDSGLSYSAYATFTENWLPPMTNVATLQQIYQSPNERVAEAASLALKTWHTFINNGIKKEELDLARRSLMNSMMATEQTIFDKTGAFVQDLLLGELPTSLTTEGSLARLELVTNTEELNQILMSSFKKERRLVLGLIGNPSETELNSLRSNPDLTLVREVAFKDLIKELQ